MKGQQNVFRIILKWVRKIVFWTITTVVLTLFSLIILLQTPVFQNYLGSQALRFINDNTRQTAKFKNIKIKWFDFVEIKEVEVLDYRGNRLFTAGNVKVDYELSKLLSDYEISFDNVYLTDSKLDLTKYPDSLDINLVELIKDLNSLKRKPEGTISQKKQMELLVDRIHLVDFQFSYDNQLKDSLPKDRFDYGHFLLDIPGGVFQDFHVVNDTIEAQINSLVAIDEGSGLRVERMKSELHISSKEIALTQLDFETNHSHIKDRVVLSFNGFDDLGYFVDSVSMDINLIDSRISRQDIAYFASIPVEDFIASVDASISGTVPALSIQDLSLKFGERSTLEGNIDFMGLPVIDETFIEARIRQSDVLVTDLAPFLDDKSLQQLGVLNELSFKGNFLGFTHDFVANAAFQTPLGNLSSDLNLKFSQGWDNASYSGKLSLDQFDVGRLVGRPEYVGEVTMHGDLRGRGVKPEKAKLNLNVQFFDTELFGYRYDSISAKGDLAAEFFNGQLKVSDENCRMETSGQVDISHTPEQVILSSQIDFVDLQALGFIDDYLTIVGSLEADVSGLNLDSLQGQAKVTDLNLHWKKDSLELDSVIVTSHTKGRQRQIKVDLPDVHVGMDGDFYFSELLSDVRLLAQEVKDYFSPDYTSETGGFREEQNINQYSIDFEVEYDDINQYLGLFDWPLYISPKGVFEGTYYQRRNATLSVFTEIDSINYDGVGYNGNTFDANFSKDLDSAGIIASVFVNSSNQVWRNIPQTKDFSLEAVWFNNRINVTSTISQPENNSSASVNGELMISDDRLVFNFLPSRMIVFGDQWFFNPYNKITITEKEVLVDRLELYQNAESILLKGVYSDSSATDLSLNFKDFSMRSIGPLVPFDLSGQLNSSVSLQRKESGDPFVLNSQIKLEEFMMNEFLIGNVTGETQWDATKKQLGVDLNVRREGVNTIDIAGSYTPDDTENQLDLNAKFNQANLQLINPFFQSLFSNIGGYASGEVDVSGSLSQPVIIGSSDVESGTFEFDYLGTTYGFNGNIAFDNESIKFNGIRLLDRDQNRASFSGVIKHRFFKEFETDLKLAVSNFQLLNTTSTDNSLYYGTANATGDIEILGPVDDLLIKANATTNKGTKLYIPLGGTSEEVTQKDYISFVDLRDTTKTIDLNEIVQNSISGVRLDCEIDVTPDAYVELIFDIRTGDIIRGRGNGNLNLSLDTNGEFELFGDLTITEGAYNFTIPNFINKEFNIVPGGTISWYGDPYSGVLNLDATYRQLASPADYYPSAEGEDQSVKQKYPVLVVVKLTGEMLSPSIEFAIQLEDSQASPTAEAERAITAINSNEQELKKQVFSLLILRKISPQSQFDLSNSGAVGGSLSEFFSNQFSYFISQVDENLEVDIDLSSLDQNAFNTFQLRLSYTFLDGRLRVSGGGGIPQDGEDVSASNYIGDWSVRYLLTPDGHLRVKAFSQTEQMANSMVRETGVSFQYLKSFNDFRELVTKSREEAIATKPKDISKEIEANKSQKPSSK